MELLAYRQHVNGQDVNFVLRSLDGGELHRSRPTDYARVHCWSPNRKQVAYATGCRVYVLDSSGNEVASYPVSGYISWHPVDQFLSVAYLSDQPETAVVFIKNLRLDDTKAVDLPHNLVSLSPYGGRIAWSPDGGRLAYATKIYDIWHVCVHDFLLNVLEVVHVDETGSIPSGQLLWSPSGKTLVSEWNHSGARQLRFHLPDRRTTVYNYAPRPFSVTRVEDDSVIGVDLYSGCIRTIEVTFEPSDRIHLLRQANLPCDTRWKGLLGADETGDYFAVSLIAASGKPTLFIYQVDGPLMHQINGGFEPRFGQIT